MPFNIHGKHVIVLGDKTTHGGKVITASGTFRHLDKPLARVGDKVSCPKCRGVHTIVEGAASSFDHGNPIAVHGCLTSCGAKLIANSGGGQDVAHAESKSTSNKSEKSNWISFSLNEPGSCEGLPCKCYFSDGAIKNSTFNAQNEVIFENIPEVTCERFEIIVEETKIESVASNILSKLG